MHALTLSVAALLAIPTLMLSSPRAASGQATARTEPDLVITSMAGRDLFDFYCASCHGRDGKGQGFAAAALKKAPPDLTTLASRNHGGFPTERVTAIIKGEDRVPTPAHGSSDMPVWGPIFKGLDNRDAVNQARIENIVKYHRVDAAKGQGCARLRPAVSGRRAGRLAEDASVCSGQPQPSWRRPERHPSCRQRNGGGSHAHQRQPRRRSECAAREPAH